ncbi:hypothetical protein EV421DRAFT_1892483 [Armillaria borealis]|uniref:ATP-dependent DNA helicase n=1 Tax=Armillaria borealis TaxID=47425 RepID=A0AA39J5W8_9AGAR|nr:hypothetical protein EV421DRAFT_1892483 [Armillaria borealis]
MCLNKPNLPFGGMNVIFAGDFAQLSPVIGGENSALYSPASGMYATGKKSQDAALEKAVWHQVTTVVILRQNMRQNMQSDDDNKLRTALSNMCYRACTSDDITFLSTRVCGSSSSAPDITGSMYRNVSIITGLNIHKDAYNRIGSDRFAQETKQELVNFYSDDTISENAIITKHAKQKKVTALSLQVQIELWNAYPSMNNKHIPGKLSLCKATELGITKGQEATVYAWEEGIGSRGQKILESLFVKLILPPSMICIPGLPENVVPLLRTSSSITCVLQDDTKININRSQIEVMPNFAMTDYCSQGKTWPVNPVDLNNCLLSRSASCDGTLILPDYTDRNEVAFDPKKIQGMCSGHLRQDCLILFMVIHIMPL